MKVGRSRRQQQQEDEDPSRLKKPKKKKKKGTHCWSLLQREINRWAHQHFQPVSAQPDVRVEVSSSEVAEQKEIGIRLNHRIVPVIVL